MNLSKTKYITGLQCPKILWMDRNMPGEYDASVMDEFLLASGNEVGDLAMSYFGEFSEVPYAKNKTEMIAETQRLLDAGVKTIAEASFLYGDNFCSVDILRVSDDGSFEIVEVKSSSNTEKDEDEDKKIDLTYLHDMTYQYYVVTNSGYDVRSVSLMQLNKRYERHGELDIKQLFVLNEVTDPVLLLQPDIPGNIKEIVTVASSSAEPEEVIGSRCNKPYTCGYKGYCWRNMPENNIYDIGFRMRGNKKDDCFQNGIITFKDSVNAGIRLNDAQHRQVNSVLYDLPAYVDKEGIREFLATLTHPLYFLDFETFRQTIPQWDFVRPYMHITFQYSLHILERPGGPLVHKEFLAKEGEFPMRALAESLCSDIPKDVCTIVYFDAFEKHRIEELAYIFPDLADHLMNIHDGIQDLIVPFRNGYYYTKAMGGSNSIKAVLPAMFPDDPELDYHSLNHIQNGGDVMTIYPNLYKKPQDEIDEIRTALLAYCRLDTLAMVSILDKLYAISE